MNSQHFVGTLLMVGAMTAGTSGCFATRMVRDDPGTEYTVANVREIQALPPAQTVAVAPPVVMTAPAPQGTLVVEALAVPPPPTATMPVRLPAAVAASGETHLARADVSPPAPAWGPLPSYVGQFTSGDWHQRPVFGAGTQSSGSFRHWSGSGGHSPYVGYGSSYGGTYGSTTGSYGSGASSGHFAGGGMSSGHFAGGGMSSGHFAGGR